MVRSGHLNGDRSWVGKWLWVAEMAQAILPQWEECKPFIWILIKFMGLQEKGAQIILGISRRLG